MKITDSCAACRRCDTPQVAFSRIFSPLRYAAIYPAGATIFTEGQSPSGLYVVCQGAMGITLTSKQGKAAMLRTCGPGDIAGLSDVLANAVSQTRGTSLIVSEISRVPAAPFRDAMKRDPNATAAVSALLAAEVRHDLERMASVCLIPSARLRFIDFLRDLSLKGRRNKNSIEVIFPYSHIQIAEYLACTRETVGRLMREFVRTGAILRRGATLLLAADYERRILQQKTR